jgi:thiol-disulfide isomerase/thioredoxin
MAEPSPPASAEPQGGVPATTPVSASRRAWFGLALVAGMFGAASLWRWGRRTLDAGEVAVELHAKPRRLVELRFTDAQGRPTDIAAFRGRVVLLNIWATWCAPCREELPTLDALQAQLGGPGFEVIALSIDQQGLAVARPFLERIGATHLKPYADTYGEATARYSATGVPLVLVIDARGREIGRRLGRATWDNAATVALMRSLIAATKRPIPPSPA